MNKIKSLLKKLLRFTIDSLAWLFAVIFLILGLGILGDSVIAAIVNILFAFFISPLRRKLLEKLGFKLKKKVTLIIGVILFCLSMGLFESASPTTSSVSENIDEVVSVDISKEPQDSI